MTPVTRPNVGACGGNRLERGDHGTGVCKSWHMGVGIIAQGCKIRARVAIKYSTQHRSGHVQNRIVRSPHICSLGLFESGPCGEEDKEVLAFLIKRL